MARSKDVYAVLGLICIDPEYREAFFEHPVATAKKLVGSLSDDEQQQIKRMAGAVGAADRAAFVRGFRDELDGVRRYLLCPIHPCPDPDPYTSS
jgi:hypothetical protein